MTDAALIAKKGGEKLSENQLTFSLMGSFHVTLEDKAISGFKTAKARALLAYLAVESEYPHRRSSLAGLFWPEMSEKAALRNLSQTLVRVRQAIQDAKAQPSFLISTRQDIQFNRDSFHYVDVNEFISLAKDGLGHDAVSAQLASIPHLERLEHITQLESAISLYSGEFLAGFSLPDCAAYEEWLLLKRENLHRITQDISRTLANFHLQSGDYDRAQYYAQRHIEIEPWEEEAHRQLIRALALNGHRTAALAHYEKCSQVLQDELAVEPDEATVELFEQIKSGQFGSSSRCKATVANRNIPQISNGIERDISHRVYITPGEDPTNALTTPQTTASALSTFHNLPQQLTSFIGRQETLHNVYQQVVDPEYRLVTIAGAGGVGKSRLALAVAEKIVSNLLGESDWGSSAYPEAGFDDGVWYISLAGVSSKQGATVDGRASTCVENRPDGAVAQTIADTLKLHLYGRQSSAEQVFNYLRQKRLLLILDNFEHLLIEIGFVLALLEKAPHITLLITSRERLNVAGEHTIWLDGLPSPASVTEPDAANYSSVRLWAERAQQVKGGFVLSEDNLGDVIQICRLVDGMPLGIELAAIWVQHFTCAEIALSIQDSLDFLTTTSRDSPARHQSLRAVFDYSWHLLTETERYALAQASVFCGSFSRSAALEIIETEITVLANLVDKSLLRQPTVGRYELHELLRQFASEKLRLMDTHSSQNARINHGGQGAIIGKLDQLLQKRHATYYLSFVGKMAPALYKDKPGEALNEIRQEMDNIRQACQWALSHLMLKEIDLNIPGLANIYLLQALWQEGSALMQTFIEAMSNINSVGSPIAPRVLAKALVEKARFLIYDMMYDEAVAVAECAAILAREVKDQDSEAGAHLFWGYAVYCLGEYETAQRLLKASLVLSRFVPFYHAPVPGRGTAAIEATGLYYLAMVCIAQGRQEDAAIYEEQSLSIYRDTGDWWGKNRAMTNLGESYHMARYYTKAKEYHEQALAISHEIGSRLLEYTARIRLCRALISLGLYDEANVHGKQALSLSRQLGNQLFECQILYTLGGLTYQLDEYEDALKYSQQGLLIAEQIRNENMQASCQTNVGYALVGLDRADEALVALQEAMLIWVDVDMPHLQIESCAGLALAYLFQGKVIQAQEQVVKILEYLDTHSSHRLDNPLSIYLICYRVLVANKNDEVAWDILNRAYTLLEEQAAKIDDELLKSSFIEQIAANRVIKNHQQSTMK